MVDVRLTPSFGADEARELLRVSSRTSTSSDLVARQRESTRRSWPAYPLAGNSRIANALLAAARGHHHAATPARVCGPSNAGNFFFSQGIEATCGFGVTYHNLHAPTEAIEIDTIPMAFGSTETRFVACSFP